jgi:hypothetical protein
MPSVDAAATKNATCRHYIMGRRGLGAPGHSRASEDAVRDGIHDPDRFEIIRTTRSMWRLKPDMVPNELIRTRTCTPRPL